MVKLSRINLIAKLHIIHLKNFHIYDRIAALRYFNFKTNKSVLFSTNDFPRSAELSCKFDRHESPLAVVDADVPSRLVIRAYK